MANPFRWPDGRLFLVSACLLLATASSAPAGDGYLPAVGPVPIRLVTPRPPASPVNWPPLVQAPKAQPPPTPAVTNPPPPQPPPPTPDYTPPSYLGPLGPLGPAEPPVDISVSSTPPQPQPQPVNPLMPFQGPGAESPAPPPPGVGDPQSMLNSLLLVSPKNPGSKNPQVIMPAFIPPPPPAAPFPSSHATYEVK